jgi:high-affinity K+ transport system ATPase subunit B
VLVGLLICLIPTTMGGLPASSVSPVSIAVRKNVLASSGRAVEAAELLTSCF